MKTSILTLVLILMVSFTTLANKVVAKGSSNSSFGKYKIERLDDHMMLNGKELDKYLITYEKSDLKVVVVLDKLKQCKKYYVLTDLIPVQYECNGLYFGIKKLDKELLSNGFETSMEKLNREVYFHQKIIASQTTATVDHLELIAAFYPELFNGKAF